jgi:hypothetical protein
LVRQLTDGQIKIPNLHLLTETSDVVLGQGKGRVRLVGIGGMLLDQIPIAKRDIRACADNLVPRAGNFIHFTFFDKEGTDAFYPSMRFTQWVRLLQRFAPPLPTLVHAPPNSLARDSFATLLAYTRVRSRRRWRFQEAKGPAEPTEGAPKAKKGKGKASKQAEKTVPAAVDVAETIPTWLLTHVSPGYDPLPH